MYIIVLCESNYGDLIFSRQTCQESTLSAKLSISRSFSFHLAGSLRSIYRKGGMEEKATPSPGVPSQAWHVNVMQLLYSNITLTFVPPDYVIYCLSTLHMFLASENNKKSCRHFFRSFLCKIYFWLMLPNF